MEKNSSSVAPWGLRAKKSNKIITFLISIILIIMSVLTFSLAPYGVGYKYYGNSIQIGVTQQKSLMEKTLENYLQQLENDRILYLFNRDKLWYYIQG